MLDEETRRRELMNLMNLLLTSRRRDALDDFPFKSRARRLTTKA